jgi:hypothetical protein
MSDTHRMAMVLSLLRRKVPKEVAGLAADAVHPFSQLGNWAPNRKARKESKMVSQRISNSIGQYKDAVPIEELKGWTRWAFTEYARLAGPGSPAAKVFTEAAARPDLAPTTRQQEPDTDGPQRDEETEERFEIAEEARLHELAGEARQRSRGASLPVINGITVSDPSSARSLDPAGFEEWATSLGVDQRELLQFSSDQFELWFYRYYLGAHEQRMAGGKVREFVRLPCRCEMVDGQVMFGVLPGCIGIGEHLRQAAEGTEDAFEALTSPLRISTVR